MVDDGDSLWGRLFPWKRSWVINKFRDQSRSTLGLLHLELGKTQVRVSFLETERISNANFPFGIDYF